MAVSVLIPVYNERWTLRELVRRVYEQAEWLHEVIAIDDGSTDGSRKLLEQLEKRYARGACPLKVIYKPRNEGKGAAVSAGLSLVSGNVVLIQDADLEYIPQDYPALLKPLLEDKADVVYGNRFSGSEKNVLLFWHMVGNRLLTLLCNFLSNVNLTDVWTGYKVFRTDVIRRLPLTSRGFGFEPEVTIKIAKLGCRIFEVPIHYEGRTYAQGKKIGAIDGITGILAMLRAFFSNDLGLAAVGEHTLQIMAQASRYNVFLCEILEPYLGDRVIEVGAGIGNMSWFLLDRDEVVLTDGESGYVQQLANKYRGWEYVKTLKLDLTRPEDAHQTSQLWGRFDSAVSCQVLEHIPDDQTALRTLYKLLKPGGRLLVMVPAHQALLGSLDKALGHVRRYGREDLSQRMQEAGFELEVSRFLNPLAVPGWWLNGKVFQRTIIPSLQLRLFDRLTFLVRFLARFELPFGLLIFSVGRKPR